MTLNYVNSYLSKSYREKSLPIYNKNYIRATSFMKMTKWIMMFYSLPKKRDISNILENVRK